MLSFYRELINFRKNEPALHAGTFFPIGIQSNIFAYRREDQQSGKQFLIVANLSHDAGVISISSRFNTEGEIMIATHDHLEGKRIGKEISLAGDEAFVALINN
jgi:alpha-glucosidase